MYFLIDNTGLQAAGLALQKRARRHQDVNELLQLATLIAFGDRLFLDLYEPRTLEGISRSVLSQLISLGIDDQMLLPRVLNTDDFLSACLSAASNCLADFPTAFHPIGHEITSLYPAGLHNENESKPWVLQLQNILRARSEAEVEDSKRLALASKKVGAVALMLALSPNLRDSINGTLPKRRLGANVATELDTFCRSYFNDAIATRWGAKYAPAAARSVLIRRENMFLINRVGKLVDETIQQLDGVSLNMPSVSAYLLNRCKGDPGAVIEEAILLRERTKRLRQCLHERIQNTDWDDPIVRFKADQRLKTLRAAVEQDLGLTPVPRVADAIELVFVVGLPTAKVSGSKMVDWIKYRWNRRRARVLTEMSKSLAFSSDIKQSFHRLLNTARVPKQRGEEKRKTLKAEPN